MTNNPHPLYRQKACKWCAKGWRLSTDGEHISGRAPARYRPCTAPTEAGYIAQLKARIAELEKDKARQSVLTETLYAALIGEIGNGKAVEIRNAAIERIDAAMGQAEV